MLHVGGTYFDVRGELGRKRKVYNLLCYSLGNRRIKRDITKRHCN